MATNDECRKVARMLRGINAEGLDLSRRYEYGFDYALLALAYIADAAGLHYAPYEFTVAELCNRLAELIDPDCRHETYCKVCGHVIPEGWGECPRCRSKVVSNDNR